MTIQVFKTCQFGAKTMADKDATLAACCASIQILYNMMATPETATSDEAIEAVVRLVLSDICYGEAGDLRVHVDGVHEMVTLRGGLQALGREGRLAKMLLL
jgi:nitrogen regulatory protein PII